MLKIEASIENVEALLIECDSIKENKSKLDFLICFVKFGQLDKNHWQFDW